MTKVFVSQPMNGHTDKEIMEEREKAECWAKKIFPDAVIIDSFIKGLGSTPVGGKEPLLYLGESIKRMAEADILLLWGDWGYARGCLVEREAAVHYGIPVIINGGEND